MSEVASHIIQGKDLKSMPTRQYLDATVVPFILQALTEVAKERYHFL